MEQVSKVAKLFQGEIIIQGVLAPKNNWGRGRGFLKTRKIA
jgi:hypothetical protein